MEEDYGVLLLLQDALKGVWIDVDKDESLPLIEELSYSIHSPLAESDVCGNCSDLTYQLYCSCNDEDWGSKKGEKEQEYACLDPSFLVKLGTLIATIHLHDLQESTVWYPNGRKGAKEQYDEDNAVVVFGLWILFAVYSHSFCVDLEEKNDSRNDVKQLKESLLGGIQSLADRTNLRTRLLLLIIIFLIVGRLLIRLVIFTLFY